MCHLPLTIDLSELPDGRYKITAHLASGGEQSAVARNPFSAREVEHYFAILSRHKHDITPLEQAKTTRQFGQKLFNFLIYAHPPIHTMYRRAVQYGLRIRLSLDNAGQLAYLPWELLRDPERDYLALSDSTSILRALPQADNRTPIPLLPPLRILVAVAGREAEESWRHLETATAELQRAGQIVLERFHHASLGDLRLHMLAQDFHVFHYIGIARLDKQVGEPCLVMRHQERGFIRASNLNHELYPESTIRMAMLTPCHDSFRSMCDFAKRLHLPATVTMQFPLSRRASILFLPELYEALAQGIAVDTAVSQARRAIANSLQDGEWAAPVLFSRPQDSILFRPLIGYHAGAKEGL
jgi:hypothetical protein